MTTRLTQITDRIERLKAEAARLEAEAELINALPDFSTAPVGAVLAIVTTFRSSTKPFVYIAYLASPERWYVTGTADYMSSAGLVEFLTSRTRKVVSVEPLAEINVGNVTNAVDLAALLQMLRDA